MADKDTEPPTGDNISKPEPGPLVQAASMAGLRRVGDVTTGSGNPWEKELGDKITEVETILGRDFALIEFKLAEGQVEGKTSQYYWMRISDGDREYVIRSGAAPIMRRLKEIETQGLTLPLLAKIERLKTATGRRTYDLT